MLNYVILTTHSFHLYSMWDFTHTCNPKISPSRVSLPLCGPWTSSTHSLLSNGLFTSSTRHPWVSRMPSMGTTCQPRTHIHGNPARPCPGNLAPHHYFAPLAIFICWVFFFFFPSPGSFCVDRLGFLCPRWIGTMNTSPPLPHTSMGSDTTCRGDKHLGKLPWVINITYKDTL